MTFINELEGYKTAIKSQHWDSKNINTHKLFDEIADSVSQLQDTVAEISQGLYGKIKKNELKPSSYTISSEQKFLNDLMGTSKTFYSSIKEGDENLGLRSEMETFIGEISKFKYLMDLSLNEGLFKKTNKKVIFISESAKNRLFTESIKMDKERGKNARGFRMQLKRALENGEYNYDSMTNTIEIDGFSYQIGKKYAETNDGEPIPLHYTYNTVMRDIENLMSNDDNYLG